MVPDCAGTGKAMYDKRKKTSVKRAREFIEGTEWVPFFDAHKKKDDLSDSLLQGLSYINRRTEDTTIEKKKVQKPRKPTENQFRTKYSKANLAYILKTGGKQDARFKKDLARYYSSIEELKSEFALGG
jgi:hypothetical protein